VNTVALYKRVLTKNGNRYCPVVPGTLQTEREIHAKFAAHRLHGEWFEATPELLAFIAEQQEFPHATA
jgi:Meiotically up-regulated gene 113